MGSIGLIWRGEVYAVDLGIPVGHEPARLRPGLVVSADLINNGHGELVGIVPITSTRYGLRSHIELGPGTTGLDHESYARCDQVRMISTQRLSARRGRVATDELHAIERALRFVFDL